MGTEWLHEQYLAEDEEDDDWRNKWYEFYLITLSILQNI